MTQLEQDWAQLIDDMADGGVKDASAYPGLESLSALIDAKRRDAPFVIGQLGQSLDGRVATASGDSHYINGPAALEHLHRLRALVDAVIVGAGTVISDDPQLTVRRVPGPSPSRVVIDPNNRTPSDSRWRTDDGCGHLQLIREDDGVEGCEVTIPIGCDDDGQISVPKIIEALGQRGMTRLLIEGGAMTVSHWMQAGAMDRLHLLVSPIILGDGPVGLSLNPKGDRIADAWQLNTRHFPLPGGDYLIDCELKRA